MNRRANNLRKKQMKIMKRNQEKSAVAAATKEKTLHMHIEKMVAAYIQETDIKADQACLVHETEESSELGAKPGDLNKKTTQVRYWFEHHENRSKINDLHPDLAYLFEIAFDLDRANSLEDKDEREKNLAEGFKYLGALLEKYKDTVEDEAKEMFDRENPELAAADKGRESPLTLEQMEEGLKKIKESPEKQNEDTK